MLFVQACEVVYKVYRCAFLSPFSWWRTSGLNTPKRSHSVWCKMSSWMLTEMYHWSSPMCEQAIQRMQFLDMYYIIYIHVFQYFVYVYLFQMTLFSKLLWQFSWPKYLWTYFFTENFMLHVFMSGQSFWQPVIYFTDPFYNVFMTYSMYFRWHLLNFCNHTLMEYTMSLFIFI